MHTTTNAVHQSLSGRAGACAMPAPRRGVCCRCDHPPPRPDRELTGPRRLPAAGAGGRGPGRWSGRRGAHGGGGDRHGGGGRPAGDPPPGPPPRRRGREDAGRGHGILGDAGRGRRRAGRLRRRRVTRAGAPDTGHRRRRPGGTGPPDRSELAHGGLLARSRGRSGHGGGEAAHEDSVTRRTPDPSRDQRAQPGRRAQEPSQEPSQEPEPGAERRSRGHGRRATRVARTRRRASRAPRPRSPTTRPSPRRRPPSPSRGSRVSGTPPGRGAG